MLLGGSGAIAVDGTFDVTEAWRVTLTYDHFGGKDYSAVKTYSGTEHGTIAVQDGHYDLINHSGIQLGSQVSSLIRRTLSATGGGYQISGSYPFGPGYGATAYGICFLGGFVVKVPLVDGEVPAFYDYDSFYATGPSLSMLLGYGSMTAVDLTAEVESTITLAPVVLAPKITQQPQSQKVGAGDPAFFTVEATGTPPLDYQWLNNSTPMPGETGSTLSLASVQPADAGKYSVLVSNASGKVTSKSAKLTVGPPPPAWVETWDSANLGMRFPTSDKPTVITGDRGNWFLFDTVSEFDDCGPVQSHADVVLENGRKLLQLTSIANDGGCANNIGVASRIRGTSRFPFRSRPTPRLAFTKMAPWSIRSGMASSVVWRPPAATR